MGRKEDDRVSALQSISASSYPVSCSQSGNGLLRRSMTSVVVGITVRSRPMGKTLGIPLLVSTIILGMPLVKTAVVTNTTFNDDDPRQNNFVRRQGSAIPYWATILNRPAIPHWAIIIRSGNNAA